MYLAYGAQILRMGTDGIMNVVAGSAFATGVRADGGPALQAGFNSGGGGAQWTPTFDLAGNMWCSRRSRDQSHPVK